jgi:hypothetical protein
LISTTHTRAKARRPNIRLTCNPSLAWFLPQDFKQEP